MKVNARLDKPIYIEGDENASRRNIRQLDRERDQVRQRRHSRGGRCPRFLSIKVPVWSLDLPGWRLAVSNQGLGLAPDELEEVFKPMKQGRARSPSRVIPGTGLGLAVSARSSPSMGDEFGSPPGQFRRPQAPTTSRRPGNRQPGPAEQARHYPAYLPEVDDAHCLLDRGQGQFA